MAQTALAMSKASGAIDLLRDVDRFAFVMSALCHDLDHPGVDNSFLTSVKSSLYLRYECSVLERHHVAIAMQLLKQSEMDVLECLSEQDKAYFLTVLEQNILATDMAQHHEMLAIVGDAVLGTRQQDAAFVMKTLITCADISNITKPFPVAMRWAGRIVQEARRQSRLEMELVLPPSKFSSGAEDPPNMQCNFITSVAMPYFELVAELYPELRVLAETAGINRGTWESYSQQRLYAELALVEGVKQYIL